jgi:hypothetical protein
MVMVFDPTKNYAEFGNAFIRGRLKGANGEARFKLTANTLNAVSTLNIKGGAVTYNFALRYQGVQSTAPLTGTFEVVDNGVFLEFICYGSGCTGVIIDGVLQPIISQKKVSMGCIPWNMVLPMAKGTHTVQLVHPGTSVSSDGYIFVKYIRPTGSGNA